jgi:hypothetical protein
MIFGSLTPPSSLAARGGVRRLNPFPRGLGSSPAGSAAVGQAPVVQDLVELCFHNFLPLFANVAPATDPASPLLASQRDGLTLRIVGAIMFLLDLACSTKASGQKVRAKVLLWWFSFATYKPIGATPQRHFLGGEGGAWYEKGVTLRGQRIFEKKKSSAS